MKKYIITSDIIKIENDKIIVDEKGLKDFYKWELDECIQNGANDDDSLSYLYKEKTDLKEGKFSDIYIIKELEKLEYIVNGVDYE